MAADGLDWVYRGEYTTHETGILIELNLNIRSMKVVIMGQEGAGEEGGAQEGPLEGTGGRQRATQRIICAVIQCVNYI